MGSRTYNTTFQSPVKGMPPSMKKLFPLCGADPGGTTGMSLCTLRGDVLQWEVYEYRWVNDVVPIFELVKRSKMIVWEGWRLFPGEQYNLIGDSMVAAEVIGYLRATAKILDIPSKEQPASIKNAITNNDIWAFLNVARPMRITRHALDAVRHTIFLLHHLAREAKRQNENYEEVSDNSSTVSGVTPRSYPG